MILKKLNICLLIFAFIIRNTHEIQSKNGENFTYGLRFKSLKCESDNKTILTKYCFLKPISRKIVTFNLGMKFLIPLTKPFYLHCILYYRYGTIFRQIIDLHDFNFCAIFDSIDVNPLLKLMIEMVKSKAPTLIHKCPYSGEFDLRNFTVDLDLIDKTTMMFPEGVYRADVLTIINGNVVYKTSTTVEAKSPLKETFG